MIALYPFTIDSFAIACRFALKTKATEEPGVAPFAAHLHSAAMWLS